MNNPLVSVIIPCFNHGKYLMECIDSVKNQTYSNIEIIVVNDGSTDDLTNKLLGSLSDQQIKVINKQNEGLAAARNTGINKCSGTIILPLDSDDRIGKFYVEKAVNILSLDTNIGLVFCKGQYFGLQDHAMDSYYDSFKSELLYNGIFCSALFRKEDYEYVGKYNVNMRNGYEDWDFWQRLISYKKKVVQMPDTMFYYRKVSGSMLDQLNLNSEMKLRMENTLFKNNIDIYLNEWGSMIEVLRKYEILLNSNDSIQEAVKRVHKSGSYRLGNFILYPLKLIRRLLKK